MEEIRDPWSMICTSLQGRSMEELLEKSVDVRSVWIELRLDYLERLDAGELKNTVETIRSMGKRVVLTYRSSGYPEATARPRIIRALIEAKPDYVDVEYGLDPIGQLASLAGEVGVGVIASYHNWVSTPGLEELEGIAKDMLSSGASIAKIVTTAKSFRDNISVMGLNTIASGRIISFAMTRKGIPSRIMAPFLGAPFTYASYKRGEETGEGQLEAAEVVEAWRSLRLI